jgi:hypothetical protein
MKMPKGKRGLMKELSIDSQWSPTPKPSAQHVAAASCRCNSLPLEAAATRCALGLGVFLSLLVAGCVEPPDRIQVHGDSQGRIEITRVPKEPVESPAPPAAATPTAAPVQPPPVVAVASPPEAVVPATVPSTAIPTDEASKQRRIDDLQKKVQEMNAEIERLKTQPATAP